MPQTRQTRVSAHPDTGLNLATIFPSEICQLILNHLLLLAQSDNSLSLRLMYTCNDLLNTVSPYLYKSVTLHKGNADAFFHGLADGKMKRGEVKGWQTKNEGRLEGKSVVARRLIWLSMVRRVELMDSPALESCVTAVKALLKRPFPTRPTDLPSLFFWRAHESNALEKPVLRISTSISPPTSMFHGSSRFQRWQQLARSPSLELDLMGPGDVHLSHNIMLQRELSRMAENVIIKNLAHQTLRRIELLSGSSLKSILVIMENGGDDHRKLLEGFAGHFAARDYTNRVLVTIKGYQYQANESSFEIAKLMKEAFVAGCVALSHSSQSDYVGRGVDFEVL
ncbi:hypothetical protein L202_07165 [Cryptococcus amylolentus CBS 6039]|uniref:F-box domain-containing protein n=2 Tax=Cryptococcus amylolentus TaxID=104669 RepID=A0A1E3HHH4_9TREE|nr:hypothetical protein L202_07165 [Cryptococcus amylolentus CBS 6039]ODN74861.1 hypothetical protein L202_07165 [Cryptococcus amylolentus CBS 6039]ODO01758.1 hypothetical protein I350_06587 [Cryptococcus amylolentus CBS 6273]